MPDTEPKRDEIERLNEITRKSKAVIEAYREDNERLREENAKLRKEMSHLGVTSNAIAVNFAMQSEDMEQLQEELAKLRAENASRVLCPTCDCYYRDPNELGCPVCETSERNEGQNQVICAQHEEIERLREENRKWRGVAAELRQHVDKRSTWTAGAACAAYDALAKETQ